MSSSPTQKHNMHGDDTLNLKGYQERYDKLLKENFDLKMEVFFLREKLAKMSKGTNNYEVEYWESMAINEELVKELEKRDRAADEAVVMISDLEEKVQILERKLHETSHSPKNKEPIIQDAEVVPNLPSQPNETTPPRRTAMKEKDVTSSRASSENRVSFVDVPSSETNTLRSLYFDGNKSIRPLPSHASLRFLYISEDESDNFSSQDLSTSATTEEEEIHKSDQDKRQNARASSDECNAMHAALGKPPMPANGEPMRIAPEPVSFPPNPDTTKLAEEAQSSSDAHLRDRLDPVLSKHLRRSPARERLSIASNITAPPAYEPMPLKATNIDAADRFRSSPDRAARRSQYIEHDLAERPATPIPRGTSNSPDRTNSNIFLHDHHLRQSHKLFTRPSHHSLHQLYLSSRPEGSAETDHDEVSGGVTFELSTHRKGMWQENSIVRRKSLFRRQKERRNASYSEIQDTTLRVNAEDPAAAAQLLTAGSFGEQSMQMHPEQHNTRLLHHGGASGVSVPQRTIAMPPPQRRTSIRRQITDIIRRQSDAGEPRGSSSFKRKS